MERNLLYIQMLAFVILTTSFVAFASDDDFDGMSNSGQISSSAPPSQGQTAQQSSSMDKANYKAQKKQLKTNYKTQKADLKAQKQSGDITKPEYKSKKKEQKRDFKAQKKDLKAQRKSAKRARKSPNNQLSDDDMN
jgi:hypothetical protein